MSEIEIRFDQAQRAHVDSLLRGYADRAADMRPALQRIASQIRQDAARTFASHGAAVGAVWPPLSSWTVESKLFGGFSTEPGVRTGKMERSFTTDRAQGAVKKISRHSLTVGSKVKQSHLFTGGTKSRTTRSGANRGSQPARPVLTADYGQAAFVINELEQFLTGGGEGDGLGL